MFVELRELLCSGAIRRHQLGSKSRSCLHDKAFERRPRSDCVHEQVAKRIANVRFTLGPAKPEKVAIYIVNQRISNVCRIAGAASQRSNS